VAATLLAACASSPSPGGTSSGEPSLQPSIPASSAASPSGASIRDGVYSLTITRADTDRSGDGHIINLGSLLVGRYRLTARAGAFSVSLDGRTEVPTPSPRRTGGEGAYSRYGFWVFLGVPPIEQGRYTGSPSQVVFRSEEGACFQKGATAALTTGTYRWRVRDGKLLLRAGGPDTAPSADGCLGRRFVFTAHPWVEVG
jgi:hypothetical protein